MKTEEYSTIKKTATRQCPYKIGLSLDGRPS